jgi:hypothetical protein
MPYVCRVLRTLAALKFQDELEVGAFSVCLCALYVRVCCAFAFVCIEHGAWLGRNHQAQPCRMCVC